MGTIDDEIRREAETARTAMFKKRRVIDWDSLRPGLAAEQLDTGYNNPKADRRRWQADNPYHAHQDDLKRKREARSERPDRSAKDHAHVRRTLRAQAVDNGEALPPGKKASKRRKRSAFRPNPASRLK